MSAAGRGDLAKRAPCAAGLAAVIMDWLDARSCCRLDAGRPSTHGLCSPENRGSTSDLRAMGASSGTWVDALLLVEYLFTGWGAKLSPALTELT